MNEFKAVFRKEMRDALRGCADCDGWTQESASSWWRERAATIKKIAGTTVAKEPNPSISFSRN